MSIAEKLQTIAENQQRVYDKGYSDGSKNSGVDNLRYVKGCTFPNLNVFGKSEVELNFDNIQDFTNLFQAGTAANQNTTLEHLTINTPNLIKSMQQMLYCHISLAPDYTLKSVTLNFDTQNCTNYANAFTAQRALEIIGGQPLNYSSVTNANYVNAFANCNSLVEVRFVPNTIKLSISFTNCSNLSNETKQSIFDGLATVETAQTLTLHANLKILQSQVDSANAKGWNVAGGTVVSEEEYYG